MTHKEHQEHNNHDTTKNGVIFELEDLSHPTGWLVGWLVANSNELLGSGKFLMEGTKNNICKNMEVWKWHANSERLTPMEVNPT